MSNPSNHLQLIGRLTRDPEQRTTSGGKEVCNLRLAVDGMGGKDETGFIDVAVWNGPGEGCTKTLARGWQVAACGELQVKPWERDGRRGLDVSIPFATVTFLQAPRNAEPADAAEEVPSADIPF